MYKDGVTFGRRRTQNEQGRKGGTTVGGDGRRKSDSL